MPSLKPYICEAIANNPSIATKHLRDQWRELIFEPVKRLKSRSPQWPTLILVIDALDECKGKGEDRGKIDIKLILQFLDEAKDFSSYGIRVLITSRPENPIRSGSSTFGNMSKDVYDEFSLHDISDKSIKHDISVFFQIELENIREERKGEGEAAVAPDWPGKERENKLVEKADKLFIYAETACRFIQKSPLGSLAPLSPGSPPISFLDYRLSLILEGGKGKGTPTFDLDQLYKSVLNSSVPRGYEIEEEGLKRRFKDIVGPIAILFDPLSAISLEKLLGVGKGDVGFVLRPLFAVLDVPPKQHSPVRMLHPSFHDFLLDRDRSEDFWVDEKKAHHALAMSCLKLMSANLKRDICDLGAPGILASEVDGHRVEQSLPLDLRYACRFWVQHLQRSKVWADDYVEVYTFLQKHLLHWLEALSLIGKNSEGVLAITSLESIVIVSSILSVLISKAN